jgi:hypothetical protein
LDGLRLRTASPSSTGATIGILAKGVDGEESRQQKRQEIFHISSIKVSVLNAASALKGSLLRMRIYATNAALSLPE